MDKSNSRRSFLAKSAAAGGVVIANPEKVFASRKKYKRKSPASVELMEIGIVTCGYYSHIESIWGLFLNPPLAEKDGILWPRQTGMVMTKVWDADKTAAESFGKKYDVKTVQNYYDMVDKVDGVIFSDYYATGWWPKLTKPYLENGTPCLINRPFALSMNDAAEMIDRSKKFNAPILVPSGDETMLETYKGKFNLKKILDSGGHVMGALAFEPCGEYPAHGVHGIYNTFAIIDPEITAAGLVADKWWDWGSKGGMMTMLCKNKDYDQEYFIGIRMGSESDTNGWVVISTDKGRVFIDNDHEGDVLARYRNLFLPTCIEFQRMIETGKQPQTHEHIMEKTKAFITGFYSHREKGGSLVKCSDVPGDWRCPEVLPDRIPNDIFK